MKFKKLFISLFCLLFLNNCSTFSEVGKVMRNEKTRTTDEFLIKKKDPLIQPPDFDKIPEPNSTKNRADKKDENSIESILSSNTIESSSASSPSSTTEESILKQIKK